ncbi:MAG: hypothetical protein DRM98_00335 [Thermoplasmata archaeon]|nr:MAG: hypothetical protein DRM98_00335 [Thermoplasmata archaeon]
MKGVKHKLVLIPETENRERIKKLMVKFVEDRWMKDKDTTLQDIRNVFEKPPYSLAPGTIVNYLDELVKKRKISTKKTRSHRYYYPPELPLSLKIGIGLSVFFIVSCIVIDLFASPEWICNVIYMGQVAPHNSVEPHISTLPILVYLLSLNWFFTGFIYILECKMHR